MIFRLILPLALVVGLSACDKQTDPVQECPDGVTATFRDRTGLDGCTYVLQLENGAFLEVANLELLDITPTNGLKVRVQYDALPNMVSICMLGPVVQVSCVAPLQD